MWVNQHPRVTMTDRPKNQFALPTSGTQTNRHRPENVTNDPPNRAHNFDTNEFDLEEQLAWDGSYLGSKDSVNQAMHWRSKVNQSTGNFGKSLLSGPDPKNGGAKNL